MNNTELLDELKSIETEAERATTYGRGAASHAYEALGLVERLAAALARYIEATHPEAMEPGTCKTPGRCTCSRDS